MIMVITILSKKKNLALRISTLRRKRCFFVAQEKRQSVKKQIIAPM